MNIDAFFAQHGLEANPFCAEEARQDRVFEKIEHACRHPEFEKIIGDLDRPSSAVVFGERGSGKTALRMQIEDTITRANDEQADGRRLVLAYDEFNDVLSNLCDSTEMLDPADAVSSITLSDHLDAILMLATRPLVDAVKSSKPTTSGPLAGIPDIRKRLRGASPALRRDMQLLQACYDQAEGGQRRAEKLRRALQLGGRSRPGFYRALAAICALAAGGWALAVALGATRDGWLAWVPTVLLLVGAVVAGSWWLKLRFSMARVARRLARSIRVSDRDQSAFAKVIRSMPQARRNDAQWPATGAEEARFRMFGRLAGILEAIGVRGIFVLVDRVDEPVAINGDPERMRAFMWPLFRNKVLQFDGVGFKFLLPIEVRDALYRESPEFFREARLDKQNLVERLGWSGPMLYDLCSARLRACVREESQTNLMDLFDEEVSRQDLVDALDQMHQPRDAFKLLYGLIQEHCAHVTSEQNAYTISRPVLDIVRRREVERRDGMIRGSRPA